MVVTHGMRGRRRRPIDIAIPPIFSFPSCPGFGFRVGGLGIMEWGVGLRVGGLGVRFRFRDRGCDPPNLQFPLLSSVRVQDLRMSDGGMGCGVQGVGKRTGVPRS